MAQVALTMVLAGPFRQVMDASPYRPFSVYPQRVATGDVARGMDGESSLRVCVDVDDIALHVIGTSRQVSAA